MFGAGLAGSDPITPTGDATWGRKEATVTI